MSPIPRIGVSVLCHKAGKVLLVRRAKEPYLGFWSLPGGLVEFGETLRIAAARELFEETCVVADLEAEAVEVFDIIRPDEPAGGEERPAPLTGHHFVLAVFRGAHLSGEARAGDDAGDIAWAAAADLDDRLLTPGTAERIRRHLAGLAGRTDRAGTPGDA